MLQHSSLSSVALIAELHKAEASILSNGRTQLNTRHAVHSGGCCQRPRQPVYGCGRSRMSPVCMNLSLRLLSTTHRVRTMDKLMLYVWLNVAYSTDEHARTESTSRIVLSDHLHHRAVLLPIWVLMRMSTEIMTLPALSLAVQSVTIACSLFC